MAILRSSEVLSSTLTRQSYFTRPVLGIVTSGGISDAPTSLNVFLGPNDRLCRGSYPHSQLLMGYRLGTIRELYGHGNSRRCTVHVGVVKLM